MRLLLGTGESLAYPCYSEILASYFPEQQRGLASSLLDAGSKLGPALGTLVGGILIAQVGWRLGAAVAMPSIRQILGRRAAWGTIAGHFCANYFWFFLRTWLPMYLVRERGMSMERMAAVGSAVYFLMAAATVVAGVVADRWIARGGSVTLARKTMTVSGLLLTTVILPVAAIEDSTVALSLLVLSCLGFGVFVSSHWAITHTIAGPVLAGRWTSAAVVLIGAAMYAFLVGPVEQTKFDVQPQNTI